MRGLAHPTWLMYGPGVNGYDAALDKRPSRRSGEGQGSCSRTPAIPRVSDRRWIARTTAMSMDEQICTAISAMLAKIGVKVDVYARTKVKYFADVAIPTTSSASRCTAGRRRPTTRTTCFTRCWRTRDADGRGQGQFRRLFQSRVRRADRADGVELDKDKRQEMINEAAKIVQDDVATIPLHQQVIVWAARTMSI